MEQTKDFLEVTEEMDKLEEQFPRDFDMEFDDPIGDVDDGNS